MRKVVEVLPALHEAIIDRAHAGRIRVNLLATVLLAYALEHEADALADADRLIDQWDKPVEHQPRLRVIRSLRTDTD